MRDVIETSRELLKTRLRVLGGEAGSPEAERENARLLGAMQALAWVLEVDLQLMNAPKVRHLAAPPETVQLRPVPVAGRTTWLLEVPAEREPYWHTEYWAAFLSDRQVRDLRAALERADRPPAPLSLEDKLPDGA